VAGDRSQNNLNQSKHFSRLAVKIPVMKKTPAELPDDVETLKRMLLERDKRIAKLETLTQKLTERVLRFEEVLNLAQHKRFSPSRRPTKVMARSLTKPSRTGS
jgi:hypothetical protein